MVVNCYVQYVGRILPPASFSYMVSLAVGGAGLDTDTDIDRYMYNVLCSSYMYVRATQHAANQLLVGDVTYVN